MGDDHNLLVISPLRDFFRFQFSIIHINLVSQFFGELLILWLFLFF